MLIRIMSFCLDFFIFENSCRKDESVDHALMLLKIHFGVDFSS